ncbi:MAG: peptidase and in kexin sedolisin, partial [Pedosphaera sp.]|nr:peptidase and in kexin sedolisin [Pedosphaera sp.]
MNKLRVLVLITKPMREIFRLIFILLLSFFALIGHAQTTVPLPGRVLVKLTPDYLRSVVYALNAANGSSAGTLLSLNATNGAVINEIGVGLNPTDMALTPAGDFLYVINAGSRTISKVDLVSFTVQSSKPITTPRTYSPSNPLYLVANNSGTIYFTDGAWGPEVYAFDYAGGSQTLILDTGGNQYFGAGGIALSKNASTLYTWQQYGWSAGSGNSSIANFLINPNSLTALTSGPNQNRDPLNTPIFLDGAERWVFNKVQKVSATNAAVLLTQFTDNIYGISLDGSVAFGPTQVFNAQTGIVITNLPFSTAVQSLSGDQKKLFRYNSSTASVVIYDMATIASISGLAIVPTPADGSVVAQAPTNLVWSPSATALSYGIFFGTNQASVTAATAASPLYLGQTTATSIAPGQQLLPGNTYYWRVDTIGFNATNQGPAWSFTVSPVAITPTQISVGGIAGYSPANVNLSLTSAVPTAWSAAVTGSPWLTLNSSNGTTPSTISASFNTAAFAVGTYSNNIEFTIGSLHVEVPVIVNIAKLNITKMVADLQRPYIYAL